VFDPKTALTMPLNLVADQLGDDLVLTLHGELDLSGRNAFEQLLDDAAGRGIQNLFIDLRELTFIDSTGISLLLKAMKVGEEQGFSVAFIAGDGQVHELLEETGVLDQLRLVDVNSLPRL
jgi:anti-sigma B factor antagonist